MLVVPTSKRRLVPVKPCLHCGTTFLGHSHRSKYCSLACVGATKRGANPLPRTPGTGKCMDCRASIGAYAKLCRHCICVRAGKAARQKHPLNGERNVNWKGGITKNHREWLRAYAKAYRKKHPEVQRARDAVTCALRKGTLIRGACGDCGSTSHIQAHHHKGYDAAHQLDIEWLCRTCHNKRHGKLKGTRKQEAQTC